MAPSLSNTVDSGQLEGKWKKVHVIGSLCYRELEENSQIQEKKKTVFPVQWTFSSHLLLEMLSENWKILLDNKSTCNVAVCIA